MTPTEALLCLPAVVFLALRIITPLIIVPPSGAIQVALPLIKNEGFNQDIVSAIPLLVTLLIWHACLHATHVARSISKTKKTTGKDIAWAKEAESILKFWSLGAVNLHFMIFVAAILQLLHDQFLGGTWGGSSPPPLECRSSCLLYETLPLASSDVSRGGRNTTSGRPGEACFSSS